MFREFFYAMSPAAAWAAFAGCLVLILYTGTRLSRYADLIAVRTGLGGVWVGLVLLAVVTSAPELITGLSAILVVGEPDLAVGSALGSCIYNLIIIAILDFIYRPGSIYTGIRHSHSLSAGFGVILLGTVAGVIFVEHNFAILPLGPIGVYTLIAPVIYVLAMRSVFFFERRLDGVGELTSAEAKARAAHRGLTEVYLRFGLNALGLIAAATVLPVIGEALARIMGWHETFVGTIFLAFATSVPEIVISVQAVRIGAVDLAIGGIFGSNLFDLLIIAVEDVAYLPGSVLAATSEQHLLTAVAALTMTGIAIVGLCSRPQPKVFRVMGWASLGLFVVGLFSALVLYLLGING
ncbi:MAG: sodium:calcium antiporter [Gemmatimonadetes bacterium]|uniref:Sodium:calcium antiporter n=1 Tax=Candidatus Kutchimonas denitrificans TaxID=3056748 RepID=A0AAE5CD01_9BACT|nr:sodium:calcium antiporter [Gemmatimonadota bacterium]NIR74894.1 sodium:calcium antiporter [Candidatus Kutchimonas denitrificans]NIS00006.1 sodium:calcium antiporter [Gemmatimonadota bacterium]NIT65589.1 sodium:calcium antiporter [Gemmatimonadota bacterium]NIU52559.1 sodium:calcium antiporter [Gemmatimonadota bacterium]